MAVTVLQGDAREVLKQLPADSVHCCVTSPPYWQLRDYEVDGQIGLEPDLDEFIDQLVAVFREVRRVLRPDGSLWVNMGDSYASAWPTGTHRDNGRNIVGNPKSSGKREVRPPRLPEGVKEKDLIGVPWMLAFALRADGWYLRKDNIWHKTNAMPESAQDRSVTAHEYVFHLTKASRYFYDLYGVKEDATLGVRINPNSQPRSGRVAQSSEMWRNAGDATNGVERGRDQKGAIYLKALGRNVRSVWAIATSSFTEAHFATYPPALVEKCINAGTSAKGACPRCGAPWTRILKLVSNAKMWGTSKRADAPGAETSQSSIFRTGTQRVFEPIGWQPSCTCDGHFVTELYDPNEPPKKWNKWQRFIADRDVSPPVPCVVLDPFGGAGTTNLEAERLGRDSIYVELNPEFAAMMRKRVYNDAPLFAQFT